MTKNPTTDISSLTNSLFQRVALEMQHQGYTVYGALAKTIRAQCEEIVRTTLEHSAANAGVVSETFSVDRKNYRRRFHGGADQ